MAESFAQCPGCGGRPDRHKLFCQVCRADIPGPVLKTVDDAWRALTRHPTSRRARVDYDAAVAAAAGAVSP